MTTREKKFVTFVLVGAVGISMLAGCSNLGSKRITNNTSEVNPEESEYGTRGTYMQTPNVSMSLGNPRKAADSTYESGQNVTYDCVYFGSYPQAEVVASEADETTVDEVIRNGSDYVVDSALYEKLNSAIGWDANGDVIVSGEKYRRIKSTDATYSDSCWTNYFYWGSAENKVYDEYGHAMGDIDSSTYHYFKYQPIKWRVLSADGDTALLLADVALDCQEYNTECESVTWEVSTISTMV